MSFKISDAIYAGNKEFPDVQDIFLSKYGDKHKKTKKSKEKNIPINPAPDQKNLPYNPSPKIQDNENPQKQDMSGSNQNHQLSTTQNMTNIDSPPKTNSPKSPKTQSDSYSTDQTEFNQDQFMDTDDNDESTVDPKLNPLYQLLECENQIDKLKKAKATARQNLINSQNRLFLNKHVIPKFTRPKSPQSDPTTSSSSLLSEDIYYNQLIDQGKWSVMWSREKVKNVPLIFDSGDKFFPIDDINKAIQKPKMIKRWNNLNLLDFEKCKDSYLEQKDPDDTNDQTIQNSEVANSLALVEPNITDFEHFHHPAYRPKLKEELIVTRFKSSQKVVENDYFVLNSVEDLSAKSGDVYLIEHAVENQPFILNVGMNSLLITYLLKDEKFDISTFSDEFKKTLKIIEKDEESPFVAQLPLNKPVQTIYYPLFRMPISIHEKNETDFLLVKDKLQKKFYIRRFNKIFCAKLLEPQVEVMKPGSIKSQKIQDEFIKAKIINLFRGTEAIQKVEKVTLSGLRHSYFPNMSKQRLRNILSKYAEYKTDKGNGYWQLKQELKKNLDSKFSRLNITPDDVCNYQSMLQGSFNLKKNGVNILKDMPKIHSQIGKLKGERTKIIAEKIELELMKTPWLKTRNFIGAFQSNAVEIDNADGETIFKKKKRRREKIDKKEKESIAGSLNDIRKKTKDELGELLEPYFSKEKIEKMERWDRVKFLKNIAERKLDDDPDNQTLKNFVRKNDSYANYCLKFKNFYQQSFENNLNFISSKDEDKIEDASVVDDDDNYLNELNEMMNNEDDNDEEEEEFLEIEEKSHEKKQNDQNPISLDLKELVPFGVCTYPTKIDWKSFGLDPNKVKMRPVVKKIQVSKKKNKNVKVKVEWIRNQEEIKECKKKPKVYQDLSFDEKKKRKKIKKKSKNNERTDLIIDDNDDNGVSIINDNQNDRPKLKISSNCMKNIKNAHENYLNSKENKNH